MPLSRIWRFLVPSLLIAALAVAPSAKAGPPTTTPDHDPFYTYSGSVPLAQIASGTVLKKRSVKVAIGSHSTPVNAEQLLYRTKGQLGQPTVTVTTVIKPTPVSIHPNVVAYLSFYDGLGSMCDPSYTLTGGKADSATQQQAEEEGLLVDFYLEQGWIVTVPDFEGNNLEWMAGKESGYGTLDALKATENYLHLGSATKIGLSGYSGGAVAADWASELAPTYAKRLNIVGVAEGGVPVDYAHLFNYINGTDVNSATMPGILLGLARAYHVDLTPYLSSYGAQLVKAESNVCITSVFGDYPGLTYQKLMKPQYANIMKVPAFIRMFNEQIMGTYPGHPNAPLFMGNGNADGIGDGVMRADDVEALAYEYCHQGVTVKFEEYKKAIHTIAAAFFEPKTVPFLQARFAGVPFRGNCSSIGPGNSLAPLPPPSS